MLRESLGPILWEFKEMTGAWRVLPDFIILGVQKGGTSSLYEALAKHPAIPKPSRRRDEVHFFDLKENYRRGINWYRGQFSSSLYKWYKLNWAGSFAAGESSPYYLFHPHAPKRAARYLCGRVKFIIVLRNPVDRAYSHYQHELKKKRERLSFREALRAEPRRLQKESEKILNDDGYSSYPFQNFSYLTRGIYLQQLKRWLQYFPRECFFIGKSEDFFQNPEVFFRNVLDFLELPEWCPKVFTVYNQGHYAPMDPSLREELNSFFKPHNEHLSEFLGADFTWSEKRGHQSSAQPVKNRQGGAV